VLLIDTKKQRAILHTPKSENEWATRVYAANELLMFDPPGLTFSLAECFAEA